MLRPPPRRLRGYHMSRRTSKHAMLRVGGAGSRNPSARDCGCVKLNKKERLEGHTAGDKQSEALWRRRNSSQHEARLIALAAPSPSLAPALGDGPPATGTNWCRGTEKTRDLEEDEITVRRYRTARVPSSILSSHSWRVRMNRWGGQRMPA